MFEKLMSKALREADKTEFPVDDNLPLGKTLQEKVRTDLQPVQLHNTDMYQDRLEPMVTGSRIIPLLSQ